MPSSRRTKVHLEHPDKRLDGVLGLINEIICAALHDRKEAGASPGNGP